MILSSSIFVRRNKEKRKRKNPLRRRFAFRQEKNMTTCTPADADDGLESVLGDDDEFQEAALFVQNNLSLFSRDDLLYLYARFKKVSLTVASIS